MACEMMVQGEVRTLLSRFEEFRILKRAPPLPGSLEPIALGYGIVSES